MSSPTLLDVVVKPGSRSAGISVVDGIIEVRVTAAAREGRANAAARDALAKALRRPPTSLALVRGAKSRHKTFAVEGLTREETLARIGAGASGR